MRNQEVKSMFGKSKAGGRWMLVATALAVSMALSNVFVQSSQGKQDSSTPPAQPKVASTPSHYHPDRFAGRAGKYYRLVWGIDSLAVKWTESGELIKFTYQVLDADKAKVLNDKKLEPSLIDPQAGVKLVVPSLEKVGQLRQSSQPEAGKMYWMAFSNKGRLVKRGDHVDVVIGQFRAEGLVVD
jgi:hypothetical protein